MPTRPKISTTRRVTRAVNLRVQDDLCGLIDQAAGMQGKSRSDFMIDAARRAAEEVLLDQPPPGLGYERLMSAPRPWKQ